MLSMFLAMTSPNITLVTDCLIALMDPTDKAAIVVFQRRARLTKGSCTLLEVEGSPLTEVHRSGRR